MAEQQFNEGVRPGGLTGSTELRILLCYLLDSVDTPVTREEIENVLLGEELANYFVMAEALAQLEQNGLIVRQADAYAITDSGRTVGRTLAAQVPRTVKDAAMRGVIGAQQYKAKEAAHRCEILPEGKGRLVRCALGDEGGVLFRMELYMPDELTAAAVREKFIENGDEVYKLVLASLTDNHQLAQRALMKLEDIPQTDN